MTTLSPYRNPIIPGFCPNPSCICVEDTYYLVASSGVYFPGIPVYVSKDLINWTQAGNVVTKTSQFDLRACKLRPLAGETYPGGLWSPTIRHHDGIFYLTVTVIYGHRPLGDASRWKNLLFTCTDPINSEWSDPIELDYSGIDLSLFFEENGAVYGQGAYVSAARSEIRQIQLNLETGTSVGDVPERLQTVTDGTLKAPHLYKKDQWYYLLYAEGASFLELSTVMARSLSPDGPWERCPHNPLISSPSDGPIRAVGCADIFQTPGGQWFAVCMSLRNSESCLLGPETCLIPMEWRKNDWPRATATIAMKMRANLPNTTASSLTGLVKTDVVDLFKKADPVWPVGVVTVRHARSRYTFNEAEGLRIHAERTSVPDPDVSPCILLCRQQSSRCTVTVTLEPLNDLLIFEAGLVVYLDYRHQFALAALRSLLGPGQVRLRTVGSVASVTRPMKVDIPIGLKVEAFDDRYEFYAMHLDNWVLVGRIEETALQSVRTDLFAGAFIGVYAIAHHQVHISVKEWLVEEHVD